MKNWGEGRGETSEKNCFDWKRKDQTKQTAESKTKKRKPKIWTWAIKSTCAEGIVQWGNNEARWYCGGGRQN